MKKGYDRRQVLKGMSAACAAFFLPEEQARTESVLHIAGQDIEIQVGSVSKHTFRLSVLPLADGRVGTIPTDGSLLRPSWGTPVARIRDAGGARTVKCGGLDVRITLAPLTFTIESASAEQIQIIRVDEDTGIVSFVTGDSPILALGEGGPQFDRRGSTDRMRSGQGGYKLATHGGRVPIPWLIGTAGWAMFIHQPFGTFDFTGPESKFLPKSPDTALPLDIFFVASREPATIMAEYARLTGHAEMPPLWSFGYQQSHRTLASRE
ncbi:MAG TPA: hypothetical protein VGU63_08820, partial [Candidatus Acidoferrales bacterium]|nr:hypothetical protein [Candidatus Acidoferrales bacterium]